jgi:hypothetical protein
MSCGQVGRVGRVGLRALKSLARRIRHPLRGSKAWGTNSNLKWSPDGSKLAFVSNRVDHSLIGVYDVRTPLGEVSVAERGSRQQSHVVARRQARRLHPQAGYAVRPAGAPGTGEHWQSRRPGLQPVDRDALRPRRRPGRTRWTRPRRRRTVTRSASGFDDRGVHWRLHALVLGGQRRDRRRQGILAQHERRQGLQRDQCRSMGRRRSRHLRSRAAGLGALVLGQRGEQPAGAPRR